MPKENRYNIISSKGNGFEIECPKCRQKSRNNLPICYAIYDNLLLESKSDLDEPCKVDLALKKDPRI
jgi:hypothetical protein